MLTEYSIADLDQMDDAALCRVPWKSLTAFNGRLLQLHGEGALGNENSAKLPLLPILCINQISLIDETSIEASFTFPEQAEDWPYVADESLEMLFQDQLDQLVGFWGARKTEGIGRALSSAASKLHQPIRFSPGKTLHYSLQKRKWVSNKDSEGGTAVFNGRITDDAGNLMLETRNIIVGILRAADVHALRSQHGGMTELTPVTTTEGKLQIPIYDTAIENSELVDGSVAQSFATQQINPSLWPLHYHFRGDPVVPGNFGTHGMIALVRDVAREVFGFQQPVFKSLDKKSFAGMIFQDDKQIRFVLSDTHLNEDNAVVAATGSLFLENTDGSRIVEDPIYTYRNITVVEADSSD
ncbi:MAG: hypothetical protein KTR33_12285 [Gammaproteobacteria bacterium]|nr:hypothetical protein [Gammaproteobacteria bacterium]